MKLSYNILPKDLKKRLKKVDWRNSIKIGFIEKSEIDYNCLLAIVNSCFTNANKWKNKEYDSNVFLEVLKYVKVEITPEIEQELFPYLFGINNDI